MISNTKLEEKWFNNKNLRWCAPFSVCCSSDRRARPSACLVQLVCRISLRHSSERHVRPSACPIQSVYLFRFVASLTDIHAPLHALSDRSAVSHFVAPLTDMRVPLHAPSDRSAVFHFVANLIGVHTIYMFLLLTYAFLILMRLWHCLCSALMAPAALVHTMIKIRHDTNWKLVVAEKVFPKDFAMMILWCEYL